MHLKLRRDVRKIAWRQAIERWGLDYRIANKITCSLESGYGVFQKRVVLDAQNQWTGLA